MNVQNKSCVEASIDGTVESDEERMRVVTEHSERVIAAFIEKVDDSYSRFFATRANTCGDSSCKTCVFQVAKVKSVTFPPISGQ